MASSNPFARGSGGYAASRPHYPRELFDWIAAQCSQRRRAWDCATGNGQAAVDLAPHFDEVIATDVAAEQIAHGAARANVRYRVAPAETSGLEGHSVDLVTVAQALHWFDLERFWPEVRRVAAPGAFFCAWGYDWFECPAELERELVQPFLDVIAPFWAEELGILWRGYRVDEIAFPFEPVPTPDFAIEVAWTPAQLVDYMRTWSAYQRSRADAEASEAMDALLAHAAGWLERDDLVELRMPLRMRAARIAPELG